MCDGLPATDLKSVSKSAENLFRCGHVQEVMVCATKNCTFVKAKCIPEMRKDRVYKLGLALEVESFDILEAECGCAAGKGPQGSCKHIAALAYALADFFHLGKLPEFLTCTEKLQQWNRPRAKRTDPIPVHELGACRRELLPPKKKSSGAHMIFDPRLLTLRKVDPAAQEQLRCSLLALGEPCALLCVLVPCTRKVLHDHCYISTEQGDACETSSTEPDCMTATSDIDLSSYLSLNQVTEQTILDAICLSPAERKGLEKRTRKQAYSSE